MENLPSSTHIRNNTRIFGGGGDVIVYGLTEEQADALVVHAQNNGISCAKKTELFPEHNEELGLSAQLCAVEVGYGSKGHIEIYKLFMIPT